MPPGWKVTPPRNDDEYFERMTKSLFSAGLNWKVIESKWPNFQKAFDGFSAPEVARFSGKRVRSLMEDSGIVRNEKKIVATVHNAEQVTKITKEFGSFRRYLDSFGKNEEALQRDIQNRFEHMGPSSSRMFLWSAGYPLTPNSEEKKWLAGQRA